jgi:hypothetical protein
MQDLYYLVQHSTPHINVSVWKNVQLLSHLLVLRVLKIGR